MATRLALWEAVCRMSEAARSDEHDVGGRGERAAFSTARVGFRHVQESGRRPDSRSETDLVMAITGIHSQWRVPFSTSTSHIRPICAIPPAASTSASYGGASTGEEACCLRPGGYLRWLEVTAEVPGLVTVT